MAVYEIDYLFQVSVYFDRDFARREVAAGYETGSNLNHCVKTRFFSQDEWHDGSLRLVPAQTKGKIASRSRIDRPNSGLRVRRWGQLLIPKNGHFRAPGRQTLLRRQKFFDQLYHSVEAMNCF
jgi:hypothetical protein